MASRNKHRERSHRSYRKNVNAGTFGMFERKAAQKKVKVENRSIFAKFMQNVAGLKDKVFRHQSK